MTQYLDTSRPFPYCPGCGHPLVLRALDEALRAAALPPEHVAVVTDIGCVGLADPYFPALHTVHTLHGRSVAIASGIRRAGGAKPIVLIGDGGAGIGLLHLVHAAQTDADVTVIVHNNLVYGMTGGQHSVLTPCGLKTTTTPEGCPIPPLDLGAVLVGAGAGFFARTVAPGKELAPMLGEAIRHPGFACLEVYVLCPTFATSKGGVTGKDLAELPATEGFKLGVLRSQARTASAPAKVGSRATAADEEEPPIVPDPSLGRLDRTVQVVAAGRAGERVQSAAMLAASAACAAGLHAAVRTDNPVTQGTGFSLAELTISPDPILYTGQRTPDLVLATAAEGGREVEGRGLLMKDAARRVVFDAEVPSPDGAVVEHKDLRKRFGPKNATLAGIVAEVSAAGWWDPRAWDAAVGRLPESRRAETKALLDRATQ